MHIISKETTHQRKTSPTPTPTNPPKKKVGSRYLIGAIPEPVANKLTFQGGESSL